MQRKSNRSGTGHAPRVCRAALLVIGFGFAAACSGDSAGSDDKQCTPCAEGAVTPGCCCASERRTSGYCCSNQFSQQACGTNTTCGTGPVLASCSCGGIVIVSGNCCDDVPSAQACASTTSCSEGPVNTACVCGGLTVASGYCCDDSPSATACTPSTPSCSAGQVTTTCLCGTSTVSSGYCCNNTPSTQACATPQACANGQVTSACLCGSATVTSGYCCSTVPQATACEAVEDADYYVAPTGNDSNDGSIDHPFKSFEKAHSVAVAGDLIYFRAGTYNPKNTTSGSVRLSDRHGTPGNLIRFWAYPGESVVFDFSVWGDDGSGDGYLGINFTGDYWHWKGIDIANVPQYEGHSMGVGFVLRDSNHTILERMRFHDNAACGLIITGDSTDNLILNCDSYNNADPLDGYEHANGFMCMASSGTTNTFRGCRAWHNADDGWDHYGGNGLTIHDNCWSFRNGFLSNGTPAGNGIGFKFGANTSTHGAVQMIAKNCLAFENGDWGFDQNYLKDPIEMYNCTAHNNGQGINLKSGTTPLYEHTIQNCVSFGNQCEDRYNYWINDVSTNDHNSWSGGVTVSDADFLSVDPTGADGPRKPDGSLPDINYLKLTTGSDLINAGTPITGMSYNGSAPDLGYSESP